MEYIQTDIWVRFQKLRGHECHYVCADDTHGTAIMLRAEKEGITPEALIERVWHEHTRDFAGFHVGFDNYYTTHSEETRKLSEDIYKQLKARGLPCAELLPIHALTSLSPAVLDCAHGKARTDTLGASTKLAEGGHRRSRIFAFGTAKAQHTKDFAEGVYLVQIQTTDFIETRKIMLAK